MVSRSGDFRSSFNGGEYGEGVAGRIDLKQYYSGALRMAGFEPVPQGGVRLMPQSRKRALWRGALQTVERGRTSRALPLTASLTAGVVITLFLADETRIAAVELAGFSANRSCSLHVEVQTADGWQQLGAGFDVSSTARTRTACAAPAEGLTGGAVRVWLTTDAATTLTLSGVNLFSESVEAIAPRFCRLKRDSTTTYMLAVSESFVDVFDDAGHAGGALVRSLDSDMLDTLQFYAEADTVGLFHAALRSQRLRFFTGGHDIAVDDWPYVDIPDVDYGGSYTKISDKWELWLRWSEATYLSLRVIVNGETTSAVTLGDLPGGGGSDVKTDAATETNWNNFAAALEIAINALPSIGAGVTVAQGKKGDARILTLTFGGALSGAEFDVTGEVVNTSLAAALSVHIRIGETDGEPFMSTARGWPGCMAVVQDRAAYAGVPAKPAAVLFSEVGEYFQLNIQRTQDSAPRLDAIRTQTSETIRKIIESKYLIVFTDQSAYYVPDRTFSRNQPVNYVKTASEGIGLAAGTDVCEVDNYLYWIGTGGNVLYAAQYNDVTTSYEPVPQSLLAPHLVSGVTGTAKQSPLPDTNQSRVFMVRTDGRLIIAPIISSQDVTGFCEWLVADGGHVRRVGVDYDNRVWLAVERNGVGVIETLEDGLIYQSAVSGVPVDGRLYGLDHLEGRQVWADIDGFRLGPYTVEGGSIDIGQMVEWPASQELTLSGVTVTLDGAPVTLTFPLEMTQHDYGLVTAGLWAAPVLETMPAILIVGDNKIVRRPGRVHTVHLNLQDTTSLAVGANGEPPMDVPLTTAMSPVDTPLAGVNGVLTVDGLEGVIDGPTVVITQMRPGPIAFKDITVEARL